MEAYTYINSTQLIGRPKPTCHIESKVYDALTDIFRNFIYDRANMDFIREFSTEILLPKGQTLAIQVNSIVPYWETISAPDGDYIAIREVYPSWHESHLYDEDGEELPHDFDFNVVINRLTTH
jgi:hypothetical protein